MTVDDPGQLLAGVRDLRAADHVAAAGVLGFAARWADLHPAESLAAAATLTYRGEDFGIPIAGVGAPLVEVTCVAEFATALHTSTEGGQRLIGHALELRHRLPRLWALVHAGRVVAWQACRVAEQTLHLTPSAAAFVDAQVAAVTGRIGPAQLDKLIIATVAEFMPDEAERRRQASSDHRHFTIDHHTGQDGLSGQSSVSGVLDLVDALDLDAAISAQASIGRAGLHRQPGRAARPCRRRPRPPPAHLRTHAVRRHVGSGREPITG